MRAAGLTPGGAPWAYGGADGELRDEAWAICPACGIYGLKVTRLPGGCARVSCGEGACRPDAILAALAESVLQEAAA